MKSILYSLIILILQIITTFQKSDPSTFSNYFQVKHYHLDGNFNIDFESKTMSGKIKLYFKSLIDGELIILDTKNLIINSIIDPNTGENLKYEEDNYYSLPSLGIPLKIYKEYTKNSNFSILIKYKTKKEGNAIGWFEKEMTIGKKYPYMFTQCESIFCREMLPIQDTPEVKLTLNLGITIKKPLRALYAGIYKNNIDNGDSITYFYEQKIPIPSYLIAIAGGKISERDLSPRVKIFSEEENIDKAKLEFDEIEKFIQIAETYTMDYQWGVYNLLILPPSFPFGGMENPQLTFATPSIIAGDKSLSDVVAHEISHSWSGNLVTNNNWENFWLNEGFTMFLQRKIIKETRDEDLAKLDMMIAYKDLIDDIYKFGESKSFSATIPNLIGRHPDDAFSKIPYEKGFNFLYYIEKIINENAKKDLFRSILKNYFNKYRFMSVSTNDFKEHLFKEIYNNFNESLAKKIIDDIKWDEWLYKPGIPDIKNDFSNKYSIEVEKYVRLFFEEKLDDSFIEIFKKWYSTVKIYFLTNILSDNRVANLSDYNFDFLSKKLNLSKGYNAEINFRFFLIMLTSRREDNIDGLIEFLGLYGRTSYLRPLYIQFYILDKLKAVETFNKYKSFYHPIAVTYIENDWKQLNV